MSFFPEEPQRPPRRSVDDSDRLVERNESLGTMPNELGVAVSISTAVLVLDQIAFAFDRFVVHDCGFVGELRVAHRDPRTGAVDQSLMDALRPGDQPDSDARFRIGLEYSDGRRGYHPLGSADADIDLHMTAAGGSSTYLDVALWIHPLPSPGPMTLHLHWPAGNVNDEQIRIDPTPILDAASHATRLWA